MIDDRSAALVLGQGPLDVNVQTTLGETRLSAYLGKGLVLYFYPKDDTPGCTVEGQDFTRLHADFLAAGYQVVGVSRDSLRAHQRFIEKYSYTVALISDPDEVLCSAFGVMKDKTMYGKPVRGVDRSTFVFNRQGQMVAAWRSVKVPGHAEEVLAKVHALSA